MGLMFAIDKMFKNRENKWHDRNRDESQQTNDNIK